MMNRLIRRILALALVLSMSLSLSVLAAEPPATPQEAALSAAQAALTYGGAVSLQYAVWQKGETLLTGHLGVYSKTENRALTEDILYGIGSVSKMYITAAVLRLAEQGKLSLDAPVTRYLKDFTMADPRYRDITVRMLLNHSSGLMGSSMEDGLLFADADRTATTDLLNRLSTQRLKAAPGAYSVYCNDGFTLAELVVEAVSGKSFPEYLNTVLLPAVGLGDTFAPGGAFDTSRLAKTYLGDDTRPLPADCLGVVGTGGLYATASDLAAFGGALTSPGLLRQTSLSAMAAPEYRRGLWPADEVDALSYGLGWDAVSWHPFAQSGIQALVKGGDTQFYHAGLLVIPQHQLSVAVVSSGGVSTFNQLAAGQMALAVLESQGVTVDQATPPLPAAEPAPMPQELTALAGDYLSSMGQYEIGVLPEGQLTFRQRNLPGVPVQTFAYHSDGTFRDPSGSVALSLVTAENGETYLHQKSFTALPGLGAVPLSEYVAVKARASEISDDLQALWDQRLSIGVLPMNLRYTSQILPMLASVLADASATPETVPGYAGISRIQDESTALYDLQILGAAGRDGQDVIYYEKDATPWMQINGTHYMAASGAPALFTGGGWSFSTIQEDGYSRWYAVGTAAAGTTMTVQLPDEAGFYVYDAQGQVTASSVLWGDSSAQLPPGGLVVFSGEPSARFHLRFAA